MNTRQQGDLGEAQALDWLVSQGADVYVPFGHAPDADLVAWWDERWVGVQVKTTRAFRNDRWETSVCTRGGNQSWNGVVKRFSPDRCDYLFVVTGDGRRWFIPAPDVGGGTHIVLGGPKYRRFEIEPGAPLVEASLERSLF